MSRWLVEAPTLTLTLSRRERGFESAFPSGIGAGYTLTLALSHAWERGFMQPSPSGGRGNSNSQVPRRGSGDLHGLPLPPSGRGQGEGDGIGSLSRPAGEGRGEGGSAP